MQTETKVAWPKSHKFNEKVVSIIGEGGTLALEDIYETIDDRDHQVVFEAYGENRLLKSNHVVFQYAVFLQRPDGSVAVFRRGDKDKGMDRITKGPSIFLSSSTPRPPAEAIPLLIRNGICTKRTENITSSSITPYGLCWNGLARSGEIDTRPTYLFAIYRHEFPQDLVLHGRFNDIPDEFIDWMPLSELPVDEPETGFIDRLIMRQLKNGKNAVFDNLDASRIGQLYHPDARLTFEKADPAQFQTNTYLDGHKVFISHAAEDGFSAYALHAFLVQHSSRKILPKCDLLHVKEGQNLDKRIKRLITESDCLILVITDRLIAKSEARRKATDKKENFDWVAAEYRLARRQKKPVFAFKLGTKENPWFYDGNTVANEKAMYADWLHEVSRLIETVRTRFGTYP